MAKFLRGCLMFILKLISILIVVAVGIGIFYTQPSVQAFFWSPDVEERVRILRLPYFLAGLAFLVWILDSLRNRKKISLFKGALIIAGVVLLLPRVVDPTYFWSDASPLCMGMVAMVLVFIFLFNALGEPTYSSSTSASHGNVDVSDAVIDNARHQAEQRIDRDRNAP